MSNNAVQARRIRKRHSQPSVEPSDDLAAVAQRALEKRSAGSAGWAPLLPLSRPSACSTGRAEHVAVEPGSSFQHLPIYPSVVWFTKCVSQRCQ